MSMFTEIVKQLKVITDRLNSEQWMKGYEASIGLGVGRGYSTPAVHIWHNANLEASTCPSIDTTYEQVIEKLRMQVPKTAVKRIAELQAQRDAIDKQLAEAKTEQVQA
jgi:hypothetical protein